MKNVEIAYAVTQKLPQIYTANHATFPIWIRKNSEHICGILWATQFGYCLDMVLMYLWYYGTYKVTQNKVRIVKVISEKYIKFVTFFDLNRCLTQIK